MTQISKLLEEMFEESIFSMTKSINNGESRISICNNSEDGSITIETFGRHFNIVDVVKSLPAGYYIDNIVFVNSPNCNMKTASSIFYTFKVV